MYEPQMADLSAADQARKAMRHALSQIRDRWPVAWYLGHGTQTFALLTEALAAHSDKSADELREIYAPASRREFKDGATNDCPFCGGQFLQIETGEFEAFVECSDCEARGPLVKPYRLDQGQCSIEVAREKWNERAMPR